MTSIYDRPPFPVHPRAASPHESADLYLAGRDSRRLAHCLYVQRRYGGRIAVTYHSVDIVSYLAGTDSARPGAVTIYAGDPPHVTASTAALISLYAFGDCSYQPRRRPVSRHREGFMLTPSPWSNARLPRPFLWDGSPLTIDLDRPGQVFYPNWRARHELEAPAPCRCRSCSDSSYAPWQRSL